MEWQKLAFFVHCFVSTCLANQPTTVLELGLSVALFELNRTIWQDFFAFLWFILPRATFLVTSYILLSWNIENLLLNHHAHFQLLIQSVPALIITWSVINRRLIGWKLQELAHWLAVPPISVLNRGNCTIVFRGKIVFMSTSTIVFTK